MYNEELDIQVHFFFILISLINVPMTYNVILKYYKGITSKVMSQITMVQFNMISLHEQYIACWVASVECNSNLFTFAYVLVSYFLRA